MRGAQNLEDFVGDAHQFLVVLDGSDKTIRRKGAIDLTVYHILACTSKFLDFEMLLNPLEEKFNLLTVLMQQCYQQRCQGKVVG